MPEDSLDMAKRPHPLRCAKKLATKMAPSHLDRLLTDQNGITSAQVATCDIVNYSRRKSSVQRRLVDKFQHDITSSLAEISESYKDYARTNGIEFDSDIIKLPTGDGIAVVFTFQDLHNIALEFSLNMLRRIHDYNLAHSCEKFLRNHWCDCHCSYQVRIGLADGRCVLYRDINNLLNVAGNAVNAASRVMNKADPSQILVTKRSYEHLVGNATDPGLKDRLIYIGEIMFKHGQNIDVWQYVDPAAAFVNSSISSDMPLSSHLEVLMARMNLVSIMQELDNMEWNKMHPNTTAKLLVLVEQMLDLVHGRSETLFERIAVPCAVVEVDGLPALVHQPSSPTAAVAAAAPRRPKRIIRVNPNAVQLEPIACGSRARKAGRGGMPLLATRPN